MSARTAWDLAGMAYAGPDDPKIAADMAATEVAIANFCADYFGIASYLNDPDYVSRAVEAYNGLHGLVGVYNLPRWFASVRMYQNMGDAVIRAEYQRLNAWAINQAGKIIFFELALAKAAQREREALLAEPKLASYRHWLQRIFDNAKYNLGTEAETLYQKLYMAAVDPWRRQAEELISQAGLTLMQDSGTLVPDQTLMTVLNCLKSPVETVRAFTAAEVSSFLEGRIEQIARSINAVIAANEAMLSMRIPDENGRRPETFRFLTDDVEPSVVDALATAVQSKYHIVHRYFALKAKLLGVERLKSWDRIAPIPSVSESRRFTFEGACKIVRRAVVRLNPTYGTAFDEMLSEGCFDVYPSGGKFPGAFSMRWTGVHPNLVLLNFMGTVTDVVTLGHELGHALNNWLMGKRQNNLSYGSPLVTAEVASTFVEGLVLEELRGELEGEELLVFLMQQLDEKLGGIVRQISNFLFEQDLHREFREKGFVSAGRIGELYLARTAEYAGPSVELDEGLKWWWGCVNQLFQPFYVYTYASGGIIAGALLSAFKSDASFAEKVDSFLGVGRSSSPAEAFAAMGIDITDSETWELGMDSLEAAVHAAEQLALQLGKIQ
jgi:oligoendopeptidase F